MENKRTFKDFLHEDLDVFFNLNEFAETVMVAGKEMTIIRTNNSAIQKDSSKQLFHLDILFRVKRSDFENIPHPELIMEFEDDEYLIKTVNENMGVLTIGLVRVDA